MVLHPRTSALVVFQREAVNKRKQHVLPLLLLSWVRTDPLVEPESERRLPRPSIHPSRNSSGELYSLCGIHLCVHSSVTLLLYSSPLCYNPCCPIVLPALLVRVPALHVLYSSVVSASGLPVQKLGGKKRIQEPSLEQSALELLDGALESYQYSRTLPGASGSWTSSGSRPVALE